MIFAQLHDICVIAHGIVALKPNMYFIASTIYTLHTMPNYPNQEMSVQSQDVYNLSAQISIFLAEVIVHAKFYLVLSIELDLLLR